MEVIVLGTAANGRIPQSDCMKCKTCKIAIERGGPNRRTRSSILLRDGEKHILVDVDPDLGFQLEREMIPTTKISNIFITHAHGDHIYGLFEFAIGRALKIPVYSDKKILDTIFGKNRVFGYFLSKDYEFIDPKAVKSNEKINIGGLEVLPFEVPHAHKNTIGPTLGYKFFKENKSIVYLPDILEITTEVQEIINNSNVLFFGAPTIDESKWGHIALKLAIPILNKLKIGRVFLTHFIHSGPLHEELENLVRPYGYNIAYDGMRIKL
jgi:phosphoribosyl 1,2-cyclic phosphodiesterase